MEKIEYLLPEEIEARSFELIDEELCKRGIRLPAREEKVIKRVIHTSADFDYAKTLCFSKDAVRILEDLIRSGADIVTDTNMALAGINKSSLVRFGGKARCFMAEDEVARLARQRGMTRAAVSMEMAALTGKPTVFVIGNAPTALIKLYEMAKAGDYKPAFIIGVPVGFVNVEAAKERILGTEIPYIINRGRKGGSNVAAAICNAVLYGMEDPAWYGFTTGSCAAAAAKAAAYMLLSGRSIEEITIETPKGITYRAKLLDISRGEHEVSCAVEKDGGDDPDITTGAWIYAKVSKPASKSELQGSGRVIIEGGAGVGRVTRPGLDQPAGSAAINHVPRQMIEKEVMEVCRLIDYRGDLKIEISVPEGERLGKDTFNPRLGIVGGISILGTSGIVEPMSSRAILDTIRVELRQRREEGFNYVAVSPGNYGLDFMKETYGYDLNRSVKCGNYIGEVIDMAAELGYRRLLLTGHVGKLIKVAGGIMNTHSREADCRMELLAAFAIQEQAGIEEVRKILECAVTEEAVKILEKSGKLRPVMERIVERICFYMEKRAGGKMKIDCLLYANAFGELARSKEAKEWFTLLEREQGQSTS